MNNRWTPGIGDPSLLGWFTVFAYLAAAAACAMAARRGGGDAGSLRLWNILAVVLLALGINKQLDLQSLLTQIARDLSHRFGWWEQRREIQVVFIFAIAAGGGLAILLLWRSVGMLQRNMRLAVGGLIFVFTYVVIRAASFHHVDVFIHSRLFGVKWNWIFELSGIFVILYAAWREQGDSRGHRRTLR